MNKLEIKEDLKRLEDKLEVDMYRLQKLNKRFEQEEVRLLDKLINKIYYRFEFVDFKNSTLLYHEKHKPTTEWIFTIDVRRLCFIYFTANGFEFDCDTNRFINNNNFEELNIRNKIISDFMNCVYDNKELIISEHEFLKMKYDKLYSNLDVPGTREKIQEYQITLKRMGEDLLLEVGNIYVNNSGYNYEIVDNDNTRKVSSVCYIVYSNREKREDQDIETN